MKWFEQNYTNHRDWILDHLEYLGLDEKETVIVLLIDFFNEHQIEITMDALCRKTGMTQQLMNQEISVLCSRKYLEIRASSSRTSYHLDGMFNANIARDREIMDSSLFDVFESEFGRPLSQLEMQKISDWNRSVDRRLIVYALREASAYQKLSTTYIERILKEWQLKGYTAELIEAGKAGRK
ncbi:MAG: DnaD domain protein [Erysipelotrichia bacterium]|nr:DnaD domain protein [Erysipelotrichia bacterium]